ncbi:MAG: DHHW family protein [Holdemanella porci]
MKQKKQFKILTKLVAVILCLCLMFTGCITGAAFFVRPATSDLEKRKLTEFPKFTMATFLNGQYFSDISIWYADTYPMRDSLMNLSQEMKNVYGVRQKTMMVGTKKRRIRFLQKEKTKK